MFARGSDRDLPHTYGENPIRTIPVSAGFIAADEANDRE
ncbi:hypothetical protein J2741_002580 [Methanolinea mesophila]|nr:hypothetical protein [Methanolinea mesophila]